MGFFGLVTKDDLDRAEKRIISVIMDVGGGKALTVLRDELKKASDDLAIAVKQNQTKEK